MKLIKKLSTVFVLLIATSCAPAFAEDIRKDFCEAQQGLAQTIMKARQAGFYQYDLEQHIINKLEVSGSAKEASLILVGIAYKYQVLEQEPSKELIKTLFGMEVFSQCYTGESSGVMDSFPLVGQTKEEPKQEDWLKL